MAAIFDGSTSDLVVVDSATALAYPVYLFCRYKAANATHRGTLLSLSDNGAGGSLDCLALEIRGDLSGDRLHATSTAAGASSSVITTYDAVDATGWKIAVAYFDGPSSRRTRDYLSNPAVSPFSHEKTWREETTTRNVGDWTHLSIGALYDNGPTNRFNGLIEHARVYFGTKITPPRSTLFAEQVLRRKANDFPDWGPAFTNNGVMFDFKSWAGVTRPTPYGEATGE